MLRVVGNFVNFFSRLGHKGRSWAFLIYVCDGWRAMRLDLQVLFFVSSVTFLKKVLSESCYKLGSDATFIF